MCFPHNPCVLCGCSNSAPTEMFKTRFWMCHFNSPTMKRTILWSPGSAIAALKAFATMRRADFRFDKKTARKYRTRAGKVAYQGTEALKGTQNLKGK